MPKKSEAPAPAETAPVEDKFETFSFPTIGAGVSIRARNQKEADAIAEKIKADFASIS